MGEKSFVALASRQCFICGHVYETGELLIDKHFKDVFDQQTVVGRGICPDCKDKLDDGYVAFVELETIPEHAEEGYVQPNLIGNLEFTGRAAFVLKEFLKKHMPKELYSKVQSLNFIEKGGYDRIMGNRRAA